MPKIDEHHINSYRYCKTHRRGRSQISPLQWGYWHFQTSLQSCFSMHLYILSLPQWFVDLQCAMLGNGAFFRNIDQQRKVPAFFEKPGVSPQVVRLFYFCPAAPYWVGLGKTSLKKQTAAWNSVFSIRHRKVSAFFCFELRRNARISSLSSQNRFNAFPLLSHLMSLWMSKSVYWADMSDNSRPLFWVCPKESEKRPMQGSLLSLVLSC